MQNRQQLEYYPAFRTLRYPTIDEGEDSTPSRTRNLQINGQCGHKGQPCREVGHVALKDASKSLPWVKTCVDRIAGRVRLPSDLNWLFSHVTTLTLQVTLVPAESGKRIEVNCFKIAGMQQ